jgi:hypothetical protein
VGGIPEYRGQLQLEDRYGQMDSPLATSMSKVVNIGGKCVNLGVAAVNYVEKPDYAPDWEPGANVTYVFR